jgi:hypothetical protein
MAATLAFAALAEGMGYEEIFLTSLSYRRACFPHTVPVNRTQTASFQICGLSIPGFLKIQSCGVSLGAKSSSPFLGIPSVRKI